MKPEPMNAPGIWNFTSILSLICSAFSPSTVHRLEKSRALKIAKRTKSLTWLLRARCMDSKTMVQEFDYQPDGTYLLAMDDKIETRFDEDRFALIQRDALLISKSDEWIFSFSKFNDFLKENNLKHIPFIDDSNIIHIYLASLPQINYDTNPLSELDAEISWLKEQSLGLGKIYNCEKANHKG